MPRQNAKAMPDKDTFTNWALRGLDGCVNILASLSENDVVLTPVQVNEVNEILGKLSAALRDLNPEKPE